MSDARETTGPTEPLTPSTAASATRPTVRWGALVWALIYGTIAAVTLWILVDPDRRDDAASWFAELNPFAAGLYALILVGIVVALFGIVGLIRRGERSRAGSSYDDASPRAPIHPGSAHGQAGARAPR